jgi:uroporphyrinogen III methyltransferase/synthase
MNDFTEPRVFLVGAGPGDPGLLTLRAAELLAQADLILFDQLVPRRLLDRAKPGAELLCVRDLPGQHPEKYPHIFTRMIEAANSGRRVVRLKGGDPLIFGRGGEEAEALRDAGIPYEIVPGVTAALAAAAYLDIPLTHRMHTSAVALVTGHELPQKPGNKIDWENLARFPGSLAIYMGIARLPILVSELLRYGKSPDTPATIVERASSGDMRSVSTRLADLEAVRRSAGLESPGLIIIGEAVRYRQPASWFEQRPLFGRRVLVTRPRDQAESMMRKIELLGGVPHLLPTIAIRPASDLAPLDAALDQLQQQPWDWIVFTSANGVKAFLQRLLDRGRDLRDLGGVRLAAIGPKTAATLTGFHLKADLVPPAEFSSEGLVESLRERVGGQRVLLARANRGRELLAQELAKLAQVEQIAVYEQTDSLDTTAEAFGSLRRGEIEFVTFTSSNIARSLLGAFDETLRGRVLRGEVKLVAISPETGRAIRAFDLPVAAEARVYTSDGVLDAVVELARMNREPDDGV